jgi:hypothetical protein
MPRITVPSEHASGLSRVMALSVDDSILVAAALAKAKSVNINELTALVKAALPSLKAVEAREIVGVLLSLYSARTSMDMNVDTFVADLLSAAKAIESADGKPQDQETPQKVFKNLLSVRPLSMISKARGIHTDHENIFCRVRILTDLRPVFDVDVKQEPVGFVMAHVLNLGYHHAGEHTNLHIAMDKVDIDTLIVALQRAKEKAATVSNALFNKCGFSILAD